MGCFASKLIIKVVGQTRLVLGQICISVHTFPINQGPFRLVGQRTRSRLVYNSSIGHPGRSLRYLSKHRLGNQFSESVEGFYKLVLVSSLSNTDARLVRDSLLVKQAGLCVGLTSNLAKSHFPPCTALVVLRPRPPTPPSIRGPHHSPPVQSAYTTHSPLFTPPTHFCPLRTPPSHTLVSTHPPTIWLGEGTVQGRESRGKKFWGEKK